MKKILIPYDFSEKSELALITGVRLAENLKAEINLLYVFDFSGLKKIKILKASVLMG